MQSRAGFWGELFAIALGEDRYKKEGTKVKTESIHDDNMEHYDSKIIDLHPGFCYWWNHTYNTGGSKRGSHPPRLSEFVERFTETIAHVNQLLHQYCLPFVGKEPLLPACPTCKCGSAFEWHNDFHRVLRVCPQNLQRFNTIIENQKKQKTKKANEDGTAEPIDYDATTRSGRHCTALTSVCNLPTETIVEPIEHTTRKRIRSEVTEFDSSSTVAPLLPIANPQQTKKAKKSTPQEKDYE